MNITQFAKDYHEKMFPGYVSDFARTDPEFVERFDNFAFDEVINQDDSDGKAFPIKIISQRLPYIGYPRSLNTPRRVNEVAEI